MIPEPVRAASKSDPTVEALRHATAQMEAVIAELRDARPKGGNGGNGAITISRPWATGIAGTFIALVMTAAATIYDNRIEIRLLKQEIMYQQDRGAVVLGNLVTNEQLNLAIRAIQEGRPNAGAMDRFRDIENRVTILENRSQP